MKQRLLPTNAQTRRVSDWTLFADPPGFFEEKKNSEFCANFARILRENGLPTAEKRKQAQKYLYAAAGKVRTCIALPTPRASEYKGCGPIGSKSHQHWLAHRYLHAHVQELMQASGPANPAFHCEMMGFPPDWLLLPFLKGDVSKTP